MASTIAYARDPLGFLTRCSRRYGDIVRFRAMGRTIYALTGPAEIEYVLRGNPKNFSKGYRDVRLARDPKPYRPVVQPSFNFDHMPKYAPTVVAVTERMLSGWRDGETRNLLDDMVRLGLELFAETLLGAPVPGDSNALRAAVGEVNRYLSNPFRLTRLGRRLPTPARRRHRRAVKTVDGVLYQLIADRRRNPNGNDDLLSRLLNVRDEDGRGRTDQEIRSQLIKPFMAGPDTTALLLSYCFYQIALHPEIEEKLLAELRDVLGGCAATMVDIRSLTYLDAVIRETMRMYPSLWVIGREALSDCEIGGYPVPKGTQVLLALWTVHRDPRWFDDPDVFRPERWVGGALAKRLPRGAYFPLGDGPHVCLGNHVAMLQAVLVVSTVLQNWRLERVPGHRLELLASTTLRPRHGIRMISRRRAAHE